MIETGGDSWMTCIHPSYPDRNLNQQHNSGITIWYTDTVVSYPYVTKQLQRDYSVRNVSTGFALAAFKIVVLVVSSPTAKINKVHKITDTIPTGM